ncbi:unnamed protein product, partial [Polarella glacialis]
MAGKSVAAYYYEAFGRKDRVNDLGEYVENWFLACTKGSRLMEGWRRAFLQFWAGRANAFDEGGLAASPMFQGIDLSCMKDDQKSYLTMHCCFKWLIDRDPDARRLWQEDMFLLRADDAALGWILDLEEVINPLLSWTTSNIAGRHGARWLYRDDIDW